MDELFFRKIREAEPEPTTQHNRSATKTFLPDYGPSYISNSDRDGRSLLEYVTTLLRHKGVLAIAVLIGTLLGYASYACRTPLYRARTTMEFQELNENVLNKQELDPNGLNPGDAYFATQIKILQSESVLSRVLDKMKLEDRPVPDLEPSPVAFFRRLFDLPEPATKLPRQTYFAQLSNALKIKPLEETRIVDISCDYPDPQIAADVVNTLTKEYMELMMEERYNGARRTTDWLNKQIETLRISLKDAQEKLLNYEKAVGIFTEEGKQNPAEERLRRSETELDRALSDRVIKQARYESATSAAVSSLPEVAEDPMMHDYQVRRTEIQRQLADLNVDLTSENPKIMRLQAQLANIDAIIDKQRFSILERLKSAYEGAMRREKLLSIDISMQQGEASRQAGQLSQFELLKREVESNRQLYESMLKRVKEYGIAVALPTSQLHIVDRAAPPTHPYSPSLPFSVGFGIAASALLGSGLILFRAYKDPTFTSSLEASACLNTPDLGAIPVVGMTTFGILRTIGRRKFDQARARDSTTRPAGSFARQHSSQTADSFRTALVSILLSGDAENKIIVISSPGAGEGKTTIVSNLGLALAETGRRVLLVDGDLRRPKLGRIFELPTSPGLADLLRDGLDLDEGHIDSLVRESKVNSLSVLPAGNAISISDLLYSKAWPKLIQHLRREFDTVLIDSPPLLSMPDARILGRLADAMVMVVSASQTMRSHAMAARKRLEADGTPVLGLILNHWDPRWGNYGPYKPYTVQAPSEEVVQ